MRIMLIIAFIGHIICGITDCMFAYSKNSKLIRTHTVATGADSCDYWYVPDESDTARNYNGHVV